MGTSLKLALAGSIIDGDKVVENITNTIKKYLDGNDPLTESIFSVKPETEDTSITDEIEDIEEIAELDTETNNTTTTTTTEEATPNDNQSSEGPLAEVAENEPQPTAPPASTATAASTGTATDNGYYIEYLGQKYYTGGKINIPYARSMMPTFEMKTVPTDAIVSYSIYEPGETTMLRGYTGNKAKSSLPLEDTEIDYNVLKQYLVAEANSIEGSPKVKVLVEKVVDPFTLNSLKVTDTKNINRFATAGKTLYFVGKPLKTDFRNVALKAIISQTNESKIPTEYIQWKINDTKNEYKEGVTNFKIDISDKVQDITFTNSAGFPTMTDKTVNVKWVDEDKKKYQVVPPGLQNTIEIIFSNIEKFKKVVDDFGVSGWELKPVVKFSGTEYNKENPSTRFYDTTREGTVDCGVDLKFEVPLPPPFSYKLKIPILNYNVGEIGAFIDIKGGVWVNGLIKYKKRNDQKDFKLTESKVGLKAQGGLEFGLKAKILPDVKSIKFDVKAYGKANLVGLGQAIFDKNGEYKNFEPKVYFEPLIGGYSGKIEAGGYVIFNQSF